MTPSSINLSKDRKTLTIKFKSIDYSFSSEFLRVHSPSAEVLGHGPGQEYCSLIKRMLLLMKSGQLEATQLQFITVTTTLLGYIHGNTFNSSHSIKKNYGENIIKK